jgi:hypothetical protein
MSLTVTRYGKSYVITPADVYAFCAWMQTQEPGR